MSHTHDGCTSPLGDVLKRLVLALGVRTILALQFRRVGNRVDDHKRGLLADDASLEIVKLVGLLELGTAVEIADRRVEDDRIGRETERRRCVG